MKVEIDSNSGFCFGVVYAIKRAEEILDENHELFCLGDIVHNSIEVERLRLRGLKVINHKQFSRLKNVSVLIRAHGEPPETYRIALQNNINLIDASCPVVLKLQSRIRKGFVKTMDDNGQIVIFGKEGHAEVNGLVGQTNNNAIIVNNEDDIEKIDFSRAVYLYSQTTQSTEGLNLLALKIRNRMADNVPFYFNDTICRQVSQRAPKLTTFAKQFDIVVFVSDAKSSNGTFLFEVCKQANSNSFFISSENDLRKNWFIHAQSVGIAGATSTPRWLMEKVAVIVKSYSSEKNISDSQ